LDKTEARRAECNCRIGILRMIEGVEELAPDI
jgi:hypothetical protein